MSTVLVGVLMTASPALAQTEEEERVVVARQALGEIMDTSDAAIPSYSRTHGLFGGVSLEGVTIRFDGYTNERFYGEKLNTAAIVLERQVVPVHHAEVVAELQAALSEHTP